METVDYAAVTEQEPGEAVSILFPDFPEATSFAASLDEVDTQAADALGSVIDWYLEEGRTLPQPGKNVPAGARMFRVDLRAVPPNVRRVLVPAAAAD